MLLTSAPTPSLSRNGAAPAMPAHAARRSVALPALLLTVAAAALGGLALLPARPSVAPSLEAAAVSPVPLRGESERAAVLARPPVRRTVAVVAAPKVVKKKAVPKPPARASRARTAPVLR